MNNTNLFFKTDFIKLFYHHSRFESSQVPSTICAWALTYLKNKNGEILPQKMRSKNKTRNNGSTSIYILLTTKHHGITRVDSLTFAANSEKAAERSSTPSNSPLIIISLETASGPLIKICFADASFFIFEKNLTASSKKFILIVTRE